MSEVPLFMDSSCLGADLTSLNEEDLLRYFLNDDFEQSPFDSKVPSSSPLLDPPTISLVSALPKQQISQPQPQQQPPQSQLQPQSSVVVKKETQPSTNSKSTKSRAKNTASTAKQTVTPPAPSTLVNPIIVTAAHLPSNKAISTPQTTPKYSPVKTGAATTTSQIHPITVTSQETTHLPLTVQLPKSSTISPNASPLSSPTPSPVPEDEKAGKRQRRLLKNRESAQLSRIRKKMYIDELERKVNALVSENSGLREEVGHLNDVLKQVAGDDDNILSTPLHAKSLMHAVATSTSSPPNTHHQARKYAGVCLLVVLFSLGLFLNVASPNAAMQQSDRLIELDNHHNKNNNGSSSNSVSFRDYQMMRAEHDTASTPAGRIEKSDSAEEHQPLSPEYSNKRVWDDMDDFDFPSPKRTRTYYKDGENDDTDSLFDVLEDDAFSDDGTLTTSTLSSPSSPTTLMSSPSSPTTLVPSTPPVPALGSPTQPLLNTSEIGVAVMMPTYPVDQMTTDEQGEAVGVLHIHLWSVIRSTM